MRMLITGSSGFVGAVVVRAAAAHLAPPRLRLGVRGRPAPPTPPTLCAQTVPLDLTAPQTLDRACDGVQVLVHCASCVSADPRACAAINGQGTVALLEAARRAGVSRVVYVSTASVYGRGTFRDVAEDVLPLRPGSVASATRAQAERAVLDHGGTVLRPHLILGAGDRWVVPAVARLLGALGGAPGDWPALLSVVDVADLGRLVLAVALSLRPDLRGRVFHANHPRPVAAAELVARVGRALGVPPPAPGAGVTLAEARARVATSPRERHTLAMLATDHWFASDRVWRAVDCQPGPAFPTRIVQVPGWSRPRAA